MSLISDELYIILKKMKCEGGLKKDEIPNNIGRTGIDKLFLENSGYVKDAMSTSDGTFNISQKGESAIEEYERGIKKNELDNKIYKTAKKANFISIFSIIISILALVASILFAFLK